MRCTRFLPALLAALALLPHQTSARADVRADVQKVYDRLCAGMRKGDVKAIMATAAPGFVMKEHGVSKPAQAVANELQMMFKQGLKFSKIEMKVQKVDVKGNRAVATTRAVSAGKIPLPDGKLHDMEGESLSKDVLVKTPQGWKFQVAETVSDKTKIDGKPFDPSMMAPPPAPKGSKKPKN